MQGSYYKRGKTWSFTIELGKDLKTGKRKQKTKGGYKTKKEAQAVALKIINEINEGSYKEPEKILAQPFLI